MSYDVEVLLSHIHKLQGETLRQRARIAELEIRNSALDRLNQDYNAEMQRLIAKEIMQEDKKLLKLLSKQ